MYPMGAVVVVATAPVQQEASLVEKATSHLLMGADLAINLKTCDILNAVVWQTKDVVKAMKKRLQNKDSKVQFYALMNDMQVRGKVLLLLDSWQEAFGGPGGSVLPE